MGRHSPNPSYQHYIKRVGIDDFRISWTCDRYIEGSRQRYPTTTSRWTDERGAERFCKKWGMTIPPLVCREHPKYRAKLPPRVVCYFCQVMWEKSQKETS